MSITPPISWKDFCREPFRLLFPLGACFGVAGVGHWFLYATQQVNSSPFFHASMQVGLFMFCFIAGFLMTALPRMTQTPPASSAELAAIIALLLGQAMSLGLWVAAQLFFIASLASLVLFAGRRFAQKKPGFEPPPEFVWIPVALLHGMAGSLLILLNQWGLVPAWALGIGRPMMQQGFLLGIVLGVGGFMAPRLMGRLERLNLTVEHKQRTTVAYQLAGGFFLMSFVIEGVGHLQGAYVLRALIVTGCLLNSTHFYKRPAISDGFVSLVWASLWAMCLGLWGAALWPQYRVGMLHITFLGGFSLMVFSVATMVVLSHSGQAQLLKQPLGMLRLAAYGVFSAVILRLTADLMPSRYFLLLGGASLAWILVSACWALFALPRIMRPAAEDEFERLHESAKRRLHSVSSQA